MRARIFATIVFIIPYVLHAAEPDSLIRFTDLVFKSEFEKQSFLNCASGKTENVIDIFLTPYKSDTVVVAKAAKKRIDDCVNTLRGMIGSKTEPKKVKTVYDYVHKTFFKVYNNDNSFCDIFSKGEYNCVSATALYAIVFSRLGIPVQIKETPSHAYLITYPLSFRIMIETTIPDKGYFKFSDDFAERFIKNLTNSKVISKEEKDTASYAALFNKYYFSSENISLLQLASLQYSNYGIYWLDKKQYTASISELKKACCLFPSERHKYLLKDVLVREINNNNYQDMEQVRNLVILCRYFNPDDNEVSREAIKNEFVRIIHSQLIENSDYEKFDSSFAMVSAAVTDTALKNEIAFDYHLELGRLGLVNAKDAAYELKHLQAAYDINPRNANLQAIVLAYFAQNAERKNTDPVAVMNLMDNFSRRFPFLDSNDMYNSIRANCLLELSFRSFALENIFKGDGYLKEFESMSAAEKKFTIDNSLVEKAYSTAAATSYKKGSYTKSKQYVKTGLLYAPSSFKLKQMLNQF